MKPLAILGPTASGKSDLAIDIAGRLGGEIVSVDSRQAYRGIDIGTAKPSHSGRQRVPHHLIDVLELYEKNDAERFARMAEEAIEDILHRGRLPILVGGSGLYFRALFSGFFAVDLDPAERAAFAASVTDIANEELFRRLKTADPESARRIHRNDRYRIVRALEVLTLTGVPLSEHFRRQQAGSPERRGGYLKIGLTMRREKLYARINERTRRMLEGGWIEEVERILDGGGDPAWPGLGSLGYPEVISLIRGESTIEQTIDRISMLTRQYAKRQLTWFKKVGGVTWFDADLPDVSGTVLAWIAAREA